MRNQLHSYAPLFLGLVALVLAGWATFATGAPAQPLDTLAGAAAQAAMTTGNASFGHMSVTHAKWHASYRAVSAHADDSRCNCCQRGDCGNGGCQCTSACSATFALPQTWAIPALWSHPTVRVFVSAELTPSSTVPPYRPPIA